MIDIHVTFIIVGLLHTHVDSLSFDNRLKNEVCVSFPKCKPLPISCPSLFIGFKGSITKIVTLTTILTKAYIAFLFLPYILSIYFGHYKSPFSLTLFEPNTLSLQHLDVAYQATFVCSTLCMPHRDNVI